MNSVITLSIETDRPEQTVTVDLDQTPKNAASDQGLHCLPLIWILFTHQKVANWIFSTIRTNIVSGYGVKIFIVIPVVQLKHESFVANAQKASVSFFSDTFVMVCCLGILSSSDASCQARQDVRTVLILHYPYIAFEHCSVF